MLNPWSMKSSRSSDWVRAQAIAPFGVAPTAQSFIVRLTTMVGGQPDELDIKTLEESHTDFSTSVTVNSPAPVALLVSAVVAIAVFLYRRARR